MKNILNYAKAFWCSANLKDEKLYKQLAAKLDNLGSLVFSFETKTDILEKYKRRIYHLPKSTVDLTETINTNVNRYRVNVQLVVYSDTKRKATKLLEDLI